MSASTAATRPGRWAPVLAGVLAAAVAVSGAELVAALLAGGKSPFVVMGDLVIAGTPRPVVEFAIRTFGSANRVVLLLSMSVVAALAGGLIGLVAARRSWVGALALATIAMLGVAAGVADPLVSGRTAVVNPLAGAAAGGATLRWLLHASPARPRRSPPAIDEYGVRSRRAFLGLAAAAAGTAVTFVFAGAPSGSRPPASPPRTPWCFPGPATPCRRRVRRRPSTSMGSPPSPPQTTASTASTPRWPCRGSIRTAMPSGSAAWSLARSSRATPNCSTWPTARPT